MTKFIYKAKDWNGKLVKGSLDLPDKAEVIKSIRNSGLVPLNIAIESDGMFEKITRSVFGRAGLKEVYTFTRQLSAMMNSGLPLTDALVLLKNQTERNQALFEVIEYALNMVQSGRSLGDALNGYKNIFGEAYIASIEAGEEGGVLEEVLNKLADNLENENEFKNKVKGAMIYPVIVIIGMIIVAIIMMIFVIPKLSVLYQDFGSEMPAVTQVLMSMSEVTARFWFMIPIIGGLIFMVLKVGSQKPGFKLKMDEYKLRVPIFGELTKKNIIANTIRTLSMLLSTGISLVEALKIVAKVADNEVYFQAYNSIGERVQKGFSIANSFEETGIFPLIVNQMVATGEATGKLDEVLLRVSDFFSAEAEQSVKTLTAAMEPLIMIVLGFGVAFLVVAIIMPIYNLTSQF